MKYQIMILALAVALGGCAMNQPRDPGIVVQEKYVVPLPPDELLNPPQEQRDAQDRKLDPDTATDKELGELLIDKQAYIGALEKQLAALRKWYKERLELLKQTIKPEDIRTVQ